MFMLKTVHARDVDKELFNYNGIIHGLSMENPVIDITISSVGWWTSEEMVLGGLSVPGGR